MYCASVSVQYNFNTNSYMGRTGCTFRQCLYSTNIALLPLWAVEPIESFSVSMYSYGPYKFYKGRVPVHYSHNTTLPMVRKPLQRFRACTVRLKLFSQNGRYSMQNASVHVQYSSFSVPTMCHRDYKVSLYLYITAIHLIPFGLYSVYKVSEHVKYTYTTTLPMVLRAFTERQCLQSKLNH